jgi:hypothetical protein
VSLRQRRNEPHCLVHIRRAVVYSVADEPIEVDAETTSQLDKCVVESVLPAPGGVTDTRLDKL